MRKLLLLAFLILLGTTGHAYAAEGTCDRDCLKNYVDQVLASMSNHNPAALPLAKLYKLTVNNVGSGVAMAVPWRTITRFESPGKGQLVIDVPRQSIFFMSTVYEGETPSLLFGRLKVAEGNLSELELYLGRSKADSGMQFDPTGLAHLPDAWTAFVPASQRSSREELTRVAETIFDPARGPLKISDKCELVENGKAVTAEMNVDEFAKMNPSFSKKRIDDLRQQMATKGHVNLGCDRIPDIPTDKQARILVDEEQGVVVSLAMVPGKVFANFLPPPGPDPEFPTVFVPDSMTRDQEFRTKDLQTKAAGVKDPVELPVPGVLFAAELAKFYGGSVQGSHRLMQAMPEGSRSPWVTK